MIDIVMTIIIKDFLRKTLFLIALCSFLILSACGDEDNQIVFIPEPEPEPEQPYFQNNPLPVGSRQLKVLSIGNSFTEDAMYYVGPIMESAGIDSETYSIYYVSHSAASLAHWWQVASQDQHVVLHCQAGKRMPVKEGTLAELFAQDWDVVVLQQYSMDAINYATFNPWLRNLIDFIRDHCTNPNVTLAWQMPWSYNDCDEPSLSHYERWALLVYTTQQMSRIDGIDVVIPIGTAIQNARYTSLYTPSLLTRDGWHLDCGVGRYIAACTWIQSLMAPVYDFTVLGNEAIPQPYSTIPAKYQLLPVTSGNRSLCQQCAVKAVENPYELSSIK